MKLLTPKKIITILILLILFALILYQLGLFSGRKIKPGRINDSGILAGVIKSKEILKEETIPDYYNCVGTIHSRNNVDISSRLTARVENINVRSGDKVAEGDVLATLENQDLKALLEKAQKNLEAVTLSYNSSDESIKSAKAALAVAEAEYQRDQKLSQKGSVPLQKLEQSQGQYLMAQASLKQTEFDNQRLLSAKESASAQVQESKAMLEYSIIRTPIAGVITERIVDPGDIALPGKILFKVFDPDTLMLEIPVRESLINKIKVGDKISFYVEALGKEYNADIREIVPFVDSNTRTFLVKICIGSDEKLFPGMFGKASIQIGDKKALTVSEKYIIRTGQIETADILADNKIKRVFVRTIKSEIPGKLIVVSGLKPGDTVIE